MLRSACFSRKKRQEDGADSKKLRRQQNTTDSGAVLFLVRRGPFGIFFTAKLCRGGHAKLLGFAAIWDGAQAQLANLQAAHSHLILPKEPRRTKNTTGLSAPKSRDSLRLRRQCLPLPEKSRDPLTPQDARFLLRRKSLANRDFPRGPKD